jgi:O-methyltransferase
MPRAKKNNNLKNFVQSFLSIFNLELRRKNNFEKRYFDSIAEISENEFKILNEISEYALSSRANQWSIIQSLKYIKNKNINGDIVECGVYKGGSILLILKILKLLDLNKKVYGYDTFEFGFDKLSDYDTDIKGNKVEKLRFDKNFFPTKNQVINILLKFNIDETLLPNLIEGKTQDTLNLSKNVPDKISFLRLDTDIYEPTIDQLNKLYPLLSVGGILHIDDYGHCPGVKKAIDEYFFNKKIWLHRIDYTCRLLIKE